MTVRVDDREFQQRMERIEALVAEASEFPDPKARSNVKEIVQGLLDLHASCLGKVLDTVAQLGEPGEAVIDALARDNMVGNILLLFDLHPVDVETRVRQALDDVRPTLQLHGGEVEWLHVAGGAVRVGLHVWDDGCPTSNDALRRTIEDAIYNAAPDVTDVDIEGLVTVNGHLEYSGQLAVPIA